MPRVTAAASAPPKPDDVASWVRAGMERAGGGRRRLGTLRAAAASCQACPLWARATQTVFGEGHSHARLMLVVKWSAVEPRVKRRCSAPDSGSPPASMRR